MELWKQWYLYAVYFQGHYNVWYVPFQLCSVPMYLSLFYGLSGRLHGQRLDFVRQTAAAFMRDFGMLGGVAALLVHDGFTYAGHPFLTAHGYLWHIILIALSLFIEKHKLARREVVPFRAEVLLFACTALIAEGLNLLFSRFGDCDMFYISPYHLSNQPVFHQLDAVLGRPAGIFLYLCCVALGAGLVRAVLTRSRG